MLIGNEIQALRCHVCRRLNNSCFIPISTQTINYCCALFGISCEYFIECGSFSFFFRTLSFHFENQAIIWLIGCDKQTVFRATDFNTFYTVHSPRKQFVLCLSFIVTDVRLWYAAGWCCVYVHLSTVTLNLLIWILC